MLSSNERKIFQKRISQRNTVKQNASCQPTDTTTLCETRMLEPIKQWQHLSRRDQKYMLAYISDVLLPINLRYFSSESLDMSDMIKLEHAQRAMREQYARRLRE